MSRHNRERHSAGAGAELWLWVPFGICGALTLQAAVFPALFPQLIVPDLVFCVAAVAAMIGGTVPGVVVAAIGGLLQDAITGAFVGSSAGASMAAAAVIGFMEPKLYKENLVMPAFVLALATVIREAVYMFLIGSFGAKVSIGRAVFVVLPWTIVLNCCAGVIIYRRAYLIPRMRKRSVLMHSGPGSQLTE